MRKLIKNSSQELSVFVAIATVFPVLRLCDSMYLSPMNIRDIIEQATIYGLMGIGITGVIITGGIDLSVGSVLALVGAVTAQFVVKGLPPIVRVLLGLMLGFVLGAVNGVLVTKLKLQPFIATMGTMSSTAGREAGLRRHQRLPCAGRFTAHCKMVDGELACSSSISVIVFFLFAVIMFIVLVQDPAGNVCIRDGRQRRGDAPVRRQHRPNQDPDLCAKA